MVDMQGKLTDFFLLLDKYIEAKIKRSQAAEHSTSAKEWEYKAEGIRKEIMELIDGEHTIRFKE